MPRAQVSKETAVLGFFKTAPIAVAALVLTLAKDTVRERQAVKPAAAVPVPARPNPKPIAPKPPVRKPVAKKKPAAAPKPRKRVRPSRARAAQAAAPAGGETAQVEDLGGKAGE